MTAQLDQFTIYISNIKPTGDSVKDIPVNVVSVMGAIEFPNHVKCGRTEHNTGRRYCIGLAACHRVKERCSVNDSARPFLQPLHTQWLALNIDVSGQRTGNSHSGVLFQLFYSR